MQKISTRNAFVFGVFTANPRAFFLNTTLHANECVPLNATAEDLDAEHLTLVKNICGDVFEAPPAGLRGYFLLWL